MVCLKERGIADLLAMAFMFILLVLAALLMHAYSLRPLSAATDRQLELKCEHLYKTLETAWVEPYTISFLRAVADNLVLERSIVPGNYLRSKTENALRYLCPQGYTASVMLNFENKSWACPENAKASGRQFTRRGAVSITKAGGENAIVQVIVRLFSAS